MGVGTARHGCVYAAGGVDTARARALVERRERLELLGQSPDRVFPRDTTDLFAHVATRPASAPPCIVVETTPLDIWSGQPAIDHIRRAFALGAHVVTANKGPIAHAYRQLAAEARAAGVHFLFEGVVMDGVPLFNLVRATLPLVSVTGFRGVLNSTTNYVLSAMEDGLDFDTALGMMQERGIAEADPALDVDGWDAAAKTAALMNVLMGAQVTPRDILRTGIRHVTMEQAQEARRRGLRLKLVASADIVDGRAQGQVEVVELMATDLLATLDGMSNAVVLRTDLLGELAVVQIDSSLTHTAYALLTDIVTIAHRLA